MSRDFDLVSVGLMYRPGGSLMLVQKRPSASENGGLWELPGGKREPGETSQEAVVREWKEELGQEIEATSLLSEVCVSYDNHPDVLVQAFLVRCTDGSEPVPLIGQEIAWVRLSTLYEITEEGRGIQSLNKLWLPISISYVDRLNRMGRGVRE